MISDLRLLWPFRGVRLVGRPLCGFQLFATPREPKEPGHRDESQAGPAQLDSFQPHSYAEEHQPNERERYLRARQRTHRNGAG